MSDYPFSHLDPAGRPRMVDVGGKPWTRRTASAEARVRLAPEVACRVAQTGALDKGSVIDTARIAGILAAKRTAELIPMCHPLALDSVAIECRWDGATMVIETAAQAVGPTGVEMEALTAAAVAALTVYDMCKSADQGIVIESIRLLRKTGGKSGDWTASDRIEGKETAS